MFNNRKDRLDDFTDLGEVAEYHLNEALRAKRMLKIVPKLSPFYVYWQEHFESAATECLMAANAHLGILQLCNWFIGDLQTFAVREIPVDRQAGSDSPHHLNRSQLLLWQIDQRNTAGH